MKWLDSWKRRWVVWVWKHTPNCAEMSRLASRSLDQRLPLGLRCRMWLHHVICVWCQRYEKHLRFLHHAAPRSLDEFGSADLRRLPPEARQRILQRLREECRH